MKTMTIFAAAMVVSGVASAGSMLTTWGEKVTSENAWRDYPRPQMVRQNWTNLNGDWDYAVTSVTNTPGCWYQASLLWLYAVVWQVY